MINSAADVMASASEDSDVYVALLASDVDGDSLDYFIYSNPKAEQLRYLIIWLRIVLQTILMV